MLVINNKQYEFVLILVHRIYNVLNIILVCHRHCKAFLRIIICCGFVQGWDDPYVPRTHEGLLKWKYPELNSVDFLFEVFICALVHVFFLKALFLSVELLVSMYVFCTSTFRQVDIFAACTGGK